MSKRIEVSLHGERTIHIPFEIGVDIVFYELSCSVCGNDHFILSMDETRIVCSNEDCGSIPLRKIPDTSSGEGVKWLI